MKAEACLEALSVAADEARLLAAVARAALAHHRRLHEDARASVVARGESDAVLVVLPSQGIQSFHRQRVQLRRRVFF